MTPLKDLLSARIAQTGPMRLAEYMAECLLHPTYGYYTTRDPLGVAGDFTTSPEISQMFGELLGLCLAQAWIDQGAPQRFTLAEAGPGRGTLMADVLRATKGVAGFHAAADIVLIEASPVLRKAQAQRLQGFAPRWIDGFDALPQQPLFFFANEFFDALPIRQFHSDGTVWRERMVGLDGDRLAFGLSPAITPPAAPAFDQPSSGKIVECCPAVLPMMARLGDLITTHGGAALIVDYGDWRSSGDTFQALQAHRFADPLDAPGQADLTAHVDFEALSLASGLAHQFAPQGAFLHGLGIAARTAKLAQGLQGAAQESHLAAYRRLTHGDEMGSLFKVLGLRGPATPQLAGFELHHDA